MRINCDIFADILKSAVLGIYGKLLFETTGFYPQFMNITWRNDIEYVGSKISTLIKDVWVIIGILY